MPLRFLLTLLLFLSSFSPVSAHSGRTDSSGCHTNHSTGDYHCHGGGTAKTARTEARSFAPGQTEMGTILCSFNFYNCSDFSGSEGQKVYEYCLALGSGDVHDLDRDNDGAACEG